jgi:hypothetical protein
MICIALSMILIVLVNDSYIMFNDSHSVSMIRIVFIKFSIRRLDSMICIDLLNDSYNVSMIRIVVFQ